MILRRHLLLVPSGRSRPVASSDLAFVANRQSRTNFHGALRRGQLGIAFRLFGKIDSRFVVVHFQQIGRFFETGAAHRAGRIDVPGTGHIQRLLAVLVRHGLRCTKSNGVAQTL